MTADTDSTPGPLALVGGSEWQDGCTFDAELLELAGCSEVVVLPTAAAFENPTRAVDTATAWFERLGATVHPLMVLKRGDAEDPAAARTAAAARFIYIGGGSPLHLVSVLKDSAVWSAVRDAWQRGAVLAASSAGAMAACDPMIDPRGGAFTLGLGLLSDLAVLPHADTWSHDVMRRILDLSPDGTRVVGIDERTAVVRVGRGSWQVLGAGSARVWVDGEETGLDALAG